MLLLLPLLLAVSLPPAPLLAGPLPPQGGGPDRWEDRWELRCSPVRHSWTALSMYFLLLSRIYVTISIGFINALMCFSQKCFETVSMVRLHFKQYIKM